MALLLSSNPCTLQVFHQSSIFFSLELSSYLNNAIIYQIVLINIIYSYFGMLFSCFKNQTHLYYYYFICFKIFVCLYTLFYFHIFVYFLEIFNIALSLTKISTNPISIQIQLSEWRKKERKKIKLTRKKRLLNNEKGKIKE